MIAEASLLLGATSFAAVAATLFFWRRPSSRARALAELLLAVLVVELARQALAPLDGRWPALLDNALLLAQLLWPLAAAEMVLLNERPWWSLAIHGLLVAALGIWGGALQLLYGRIELVVVALAGLLTALWARGKPSVRPPEFGALAIIVGSLVGLLWLAGDVASRPRWATNGKVWAWMMLLIGLRLLGGCWGRSGAR